MSTFPCVICAAQISSESMFCFNCGSKAKCPNCKDRLAKDAKFCSNCGDAVGIANSEIGQNTLKYHRTKDELFCEVSLTDEVGKEGIKGLIQNLTNNQTGYSQIGIGDSDTVETDVEILENSISNAINNVDHVDNKAKFTQHSTTSNSQFPYIGDLELNVNCTEAEWILIYAFYESNFGQKFFTKRAVYDRYLLSRKSVAHVKNLSSNWKKLFKIYFASVNSTDIKFKTEDLTYLKNLITGKEKGNVRNVVKKKAIKNSETSELESDSKKPSSKSKSKSSNNTSYNFVGDLNLYPDKQSNLRDFYGQFVVKNTPETILVIVYYLEKIIKHSNIGEDAIYTCYKDVNVPVPNIRSAFNNIRVRYGWLDTTSFNDIKITTTGENHLEHKMKKNLAK